MKRFTFSVLLFSLFCIFFGISSVHAQPYPNRPIQFIIPLVAGSAMDINGRLIADELGKILGTQMVVTNKVGAAMTLGTDFVAKSDDFVATADRLLDYAENCAADKAENDRGR